MRRLTYRPTTSITLAEPYDYNMGKFIGYLSLNVDNPDDHWSYLSEETPEVQSMMKKADASYHGEILQDLHENLDIRSPDPC